MYMDRRGFFRFGLGGAATMLTAAAAPLLRSTEAYAIAGVDDAVVGALLLAMLGLAGYTAATQLTSTSLANMGYSFSEFAADVNNQRAAVTRAIADANNLSVQVNRQNAEDAAASIAAGTGAFGDWLADVAATGRATIDGWLGGAGANQAALWGLVSEWRDAVLSPYATAGSGAVVGGSAVANWTSRGLVVRLGDLQTLAGLFGSGITLPSGVTSGVFVPDAHQLHVFFWGDGDVVSVYPGAGPSVNIDVADNRKVWNYYKDVGSSSFSSFQMGWDAGVSGVSGDVVVTSDLLVGPTLPGVDRAVDSPDTLGTGYDITPVASDAVIGQDGSITDSGSIAVPIGVALPGVDVPYSQGLYGLDAGVVPGIQSLPYSADLTDAWVGTNEGVVSMPISQAIASSTSIGATAAPSEPIVPPDTPDVGPWQPAYDLPFYDVWPFNMIYTLVSELSTLGGE